MDKITTRTLQTFILDLASEKRYDSKGKEFPPYAPKTIRNYISFISSIFDYAVKMQMLSDNPCKNVVLPSRRTKEREVYSLDEVQHMLELFEDESEVNYNCTEEIHINVEYISLLKSALFLELSVDLWYNVIITNY